MDSLRHQLFTDSSSDGHQFSDDHFSDDFQEDENTTNSSSPDYDYDGKHYSDDFISDQASYNLDFIDDLF